MNTGLAKNCIPLYTHKVPAGFPSPADDYIETSLDLNEHLVQRPTSTFFVRVIGESMIGAGIFNNDLLVVDKSLEAKSGDIVLATVSGEFTLKRFIKKGRGIFLEPENPKFKAIKISKEMDFSIWGVAIHAIRNLR